MSKSGKRFPNKLPFVLMGGHICVDVAQGGLASVLPFLVIQSGFSYAEITALVLAANSASAIIQPLFGWLGDRKARPWLMSAGVALAGIGLALVGVLQSYWLIVAAAIFGRRQRHAAPRGRAPGEFGWRRRQGCQHVGVFCGRSGGFFCLGPIISVAAITAPGLSGTLVYLAICIPHALVLLALNKRFFQFGVRKAGGPVGVRSRWFWTRFPCAPSCSMA